MPAVRPFVRLVLLGLLTPLAACFEDTPTDDDPAQTASGTAGTSRPRSVSVRPG